MNTRLPHKRKAKDTKAKTATINLTLLVSLLLLALVPSSQAAEWTAYPTSIANPISQVRTYETYAMAYSPGGEILLFNSTDWKQIIDPVDSTFGIAGFDKSTDGFFYWFFQNSSTGNNRLQIYYYDPVSETWNWIENRTLSSNIDAFDGQGQTRCIHDGNGYDGDDTTPECYILLVNNTILTYPSSIQQPPETLTDPIMLATGQDLLTHASATTYIYNGISWVNKGTLSGTLARYYLHSSIRIVVGAFNALTFPFGYRYNGTSLAFDSIPQTSTGSVYYQAIEPTSSGKIWALSTGEALYSNQNYYDNVFVNTENLTHPGQPLDIDFDVLNDNTGWIGTSTSWFYKWGETAGQGISTTPPNATIYNLAQYTSLNPNITSIVAITPITTTKTYAIARTSNNLTLVSYDVTNPTNIITQTLTTPFNKQPRSLDALGNTLIAGTNSNALLYNETESEDITLLSLKATMQNGAFSDDLTSVHYTTGEDAYACDAITTGEILRYNTTLGDDTDSQGEKCKDIANAGNTLYFWEGTNGVKIKDENLTAITTLNIVTSNPTTDPSDALSTYGNYLAIITGRNTIKIYDTTTPTNPVFEWECRAQNDISAIEMLDNNKIAVATATPSIELCNKNDTALYDPINNYYVTKLLTSTGLGSAIRDIRRNAESLSFSTAETTQYGYYFLTTGTLETSTLAPVITSVSVSRETPCINQTITGKINGYDLDSTPTNLVYGLTCGGATSQIYSTTSGEFSCSWNSAGTKTITATLSDFQTGETGYQHTTTFTKSISATSSCSADNTLTFQLRDYDQPSILISGVLVNILGQTSSLTNDAGLASFTLTTAGVYNVSFSKEPLYISETDSVQTGDGTRTKYLKSKYTNASGTLTSKTILYVIVKDENTQTIIPGALVSATNPIGGESKQSYTDQTGTATLADVAGGVNLIISASANTYVNRFTNQILTSGETKTLTILLNKVGYTNASSGRGCQDYLRSFVLCSPLNTTANGDNCDSDDDCIGGRCQLGIPGGQRVCSAANYTYCDERGFDRGGWCVINQAVFRGGEKASNWMLDNLLYVLAFVVILIMIVIVAGRVRK